jgi:23S rRNA-/tRNA-specific pseudouridylate synthase
LATIQPWYCINALVKPRIPYYEPKQGITKIESRRFMHDPTRVELILSLYTWRTHQIRVHLSERWLPICWDYLYNPWPWWQEKTMALTAFRLYFRDNEGENVVCEI